MMADCPALVVVTLPDRSGKHVFVLATIIHAKAMVRDVRQYRALIAALRPTRQREIVPAPSYGRRHGAEPFTTCATR